MIYTWDNLCGYCIAGLITNASMQARVAYKSDVGAETSQRFYYDFQSRVQSREVEKVGMAMLDAWNAGHRIEIGPMWAKPAMVAIHGTKLCDAHLVEEYQRIYNPQTVRMAQWRR